MSDPGEAHDPIDRAYAKAEAMLNDDEARAARRARVLAAVASQPAAPVETARRSSLLWRRGGWLVAACIGGLGLIVASQMYQPFWRPPQTRPATSAAPAAAHSPTAAAPATATSPAPPAPSAIPAPRNAQAPAAVSAPPTATGPEISTQAPPTPEAQAPPPPAPAPAVSADRAAAFPQEKASAAPSAVARDEAAEAPKAARGVDRREAASGFAAPPATSMGSLAAPDATAAERAARLRAAAAAGRTKDIEALLDQGVPVDASDAEGNTALMLSIRDNRPGAAALLRRHGASLDRTNRAGESARDLAADRGDAALSRAIGTGP
jgi:hypothetical protein